MRIFQKIFFTTLFLSLLWSGNISLACTDFRLTGQDGTVIITRSMEFAQELQSNLRSSARGRTFTTRAPDGNAGITWKAKYGYVYVDALNQDIAIDGMNENGLSIEALYLPNYAQYQSVPAGKNNQALPYLNFGDWVLSNFKTIEEVKQALPNVYVFTQLVPGMGELVFPLHYAIYDATGKGIVVEYVNGKLSIYDNKIGVLTNAPEYDWHITNLSNYVYLKTTAPSPILDNGMQFMATGQGAGMMGLPGDISPPSRFVKVSVLTRAVIQANDATGTLNLAEHIINNVDIPKGITREPQDNNKYTNESTQWVVFKDLTHKLFYFRTYGNLSLRMVDLAKINFSENAAPLKMPLADNQASIQNVTSVFTTSAPQKTTASKN